MLGLYGRSRRHIQHAMPDAERAELQSSLLKAASYSAADALLEVELRNGSVYQYSGVPASTYKNLLQVRICCKRNPKAAISISTFATATRPRN